MCWVGVVDGTVLPIHWFEENDSCVSVNGDSCLDMLKSVVWPAISRSAKSFGFFAAKRKKFWFQQDGVPCHCTNRCLQFLNDNEKNIKIKKINKKFNINYLSSK